MIAEQLSRELDFEYYCTAHVMEKQWALYNLERFVRPKTQITN